MSSGHWKAKQVRSCSRVSWGAARGGPTRRRALVRVWAEMLSCESGRSQTARGETPPDRAVRDPGACWMLTAVSR